MKLFPLPTSAFVAAATMTAGLAATPAVAETPQFNGCQEIHWNTFGEAVASNDPDRIQLFLQMHGNGCQPLAATAQVLLCQLDPAACLAVVEPAAEPEPEPEPEYEPLYMQIQSDFAFRRPGQSIGQENDRTDNSSPASPSTPSSSPSGGETSSPGGDSGSDDK